MSSSIEVNGFKLDESFFQKILSSSFKDETVKVLRVEGNFVENDGTHYMSNIFRLNVKYATMGNEKEEKNVGVIIKAEPINNPIALAFLREQRLYFRELTVFENILPIAEKLVRRQIGPRLFYSSPEPLFLVMEDLTTRNFVLKHRKEGLSLSHCLLVIEQLAKFHAASVAIREKDPDSMSRFESRLFSVDSSECFERMIEMSIMNVGRSIRKWPEDFWPNIADKLEKRSKTIREELAVIFDYEPHEFCVLNHGDCWTNNVLFEENSSGKPIAAILIDFQAAVYTSPAIDLHYFLSICPEVPLKAVKDDFFLVAYLDILTKTMESIGCRTKAPTMQELKVAMRKRSGYSVTSALAFYPRSLIDSDDPENMNQVMMKLNGETKLDISTNAKMSQAVRQMLPLMDERGYLD